MSLIPSAADGNAPVASTGSGAHLRIVLAAAFLASALPALADVMPPERRTTWNPGIPGGIPVRTTACANINASTYGNGTTDATAGIQAVARMSPRAQIERPTWSPTCGSSSQRRS